MESNRDRSILGLLTIPSLSSSSSSSPPEDIIVSPASSCLTTIEDVEDAILTSSVLCKKRQGELLFHRRQKYKRSKHSKLESLFVIHPKIKEENNKNPLTQFLSNTVHLLFPYLFADEICRLSTLCRMTSLSSRMLFSWMEQLLLPSLPYWCQCAHMTKLLTVDQFREVGPSSLSSSSLTSSPDDHSDDADDDEEGWCPPQSFSSDAQHRDRTCFQSSLKWLEPISSDVADDVLSFPSSSSSTTTTLVPFVPRFNKSKSCMYLFYPLRHKSQLPYQPAQCFRHSSIQMNPDTRRDRHQLVYFDSTGYLHKTVSVVPERYAVTARSTLNYLLCMIRDYYKKCIKMKMTSSSKRVSSQIRKKKVSHLDDDEVHPNHHVQRFLPAPTTTTHITSSSSSSSPRDHLSYEEDGSFNILDKREFIEDQLQSFRHWLTHVTPIGRTPLFSCSTLYWSIPMKRRIALFSRLS